MLIRGLEEQCVGGEVYSRVLPAFGSADDAGKPPPAFVLGLAARVVPELRRRTAAARTAIAENRVQRWVDEWHSHDRAAMEARAAALIGVDLAALDDSGLVAHLDEAMRFMRDGYRIHFRLVMPWAQAMYRLHRFVADQLGWDDGDIVAMLGGHSPATSGSDRALGEIRARIRATDGALAALAAQPARPIGVLAGLDPSLARDVQAWIDEHGWGSVNFDAGVPVLAERPTMVTRLLLAEPEAVDHRAADAVADQARTALAVGQRAEFDAALGARAPCIRCGRRTPSSWAIGRSRCCAARCSRSGSGWPIGARCRRRATPPTWSSTSSGRR
ncbi:MAG: hypothetical protein R2695_02965 [Acidimicrobiales bacterium]